MVKKLVALMLFALPAFATTGEIIPPLPTSMSTSLPLGLSANWLLNLA